MSEHRRAGDEVAARLLVVACTTALAADRSGQAEIVAWLKAEDLWAVASPLEAAFLRAETVGPQADRDFSWGAEHVFVLAWALGLTDAALDPVRQAACGDVLNRIPAPGESTLDFRRTATLRSAKALTRAAEAMADAHASCRRARLHQQPALHGYDIEVAQERHRALNWLAGHEGADWDHVTTDT